MIILGLDIATVTGWAIYDTDKSPSAIRSGSFKLVGDTAFEKVVDMRARLPRLIREEKPQFAAVEAPLEFAPQFKKVRKDMLGEKEEAGTTINTKTIAQLNRLSGAAIMAVIGQNVPCVEVRAQTWQSVIPASIAGKPKQRAAAYCDMLKIVSPNMDSRDACVIALWCAGHCQELRMLQRARAAA